jgi:hypothetical protein
MNHIVMDYLTRKMKDERDYAERDYAERDYAPRRRDRRGRYMRDRLDHGDYDYDERDYDDYGHREPLHLSKADFHKWKKMIENDDGTKGPHYDSEQVNHIAQKLGIKFNEFSEKEFCMTVNMIYADYGHVIAKYVPPDKELQACAEFALAFLDDVDGPDPSEKLALYFHCIVCSGEL